MKSCYQFIFDSLVAPDGNGSGSTSGVSPLKWNDISCLSLPPKIKVFL